MEKEISGRTAGGAGGVPGIGNLLTEGVLCENENKIGRASCRERV